MRIQLTAPTKALQQEILDFKREHVIYGERIIHGGALLDETDDYDTWLGILECNQTPQKNDFDLVPHTTLVAVRTDDQYVLGIIDIRHRLNGFLREHGGHIGCSIRPKERNKGYGTQMLRQGLEVCRSLSLSKVMVTCYEENIASAKMIQNCGGVLTQEKVYANGRVAQVYWVAL